MSIPHWYAYAALATSCGVALGSARLLIIIAPRIGFLDHPGAHKNHAAPTPLLGGLAVLAGGGAGLAILASAHHLAPRACALWAIAGVAASLLGLLDDRHPLSPIPKLIGLAIVTTVPAVAAWLLGCASLGHAAICVCALMFFTNSFNLLDNSDGLCATVAAASCTVLALLCGNQSALMVSAACTGFLAWNWPRARIFLGDTGSLLIGSWVVWAGMLSDSTARIQPALPLVAVWVPVYDTLSVVVVRLRAGRSILQGGQDHFSHRLMRRGISGAMVNRLLGGGTLAAGVIALVLPPQWQPWVALAFVCTAGLIETLVPIRRG